MSIACGDSTQMGQIVVSRATAFTGFGCYLDLSGSMRGLFYEGKGLLDGFVNATRDVMAFWEKYWSVVLDYWGLTVRCLVGEELPTSQDKYVVQNFMRRIETERVANRTGRIVNKMPVFNAGQYRVVNKQFFVLLPTIAKLKRTNRFFNTTL